MSVQDRSFRDDAVAWITAAVAAIGITLGSAPLPAGGTALAGEHFLRVVLTGAVHVVDGDTLEADLDMDGRLEFPRERVRLLYVDAPELSDSWKGMDLLHGIPAKEFLQRSLQSGPAELRISARRPTGKYGRTLAVLRVGTRDINRALVREGHSYFDTRFGFPANYEAYSLAEGLAFAESKGIWADGVSRRRYLARLKREGKTPRAKGNPLYGGGLYTVAHLNVELRMGTYVRICGNVLRVQKRRKGVRRIELAGARPGGVIDAVAFAKTAQRLGVDEWRVGAPVELEGFLKRYRGSPQLVVHFGGPASSPADGACRGTISRAHRPLPFGRDIVMIASGSVRMEPDSRPALGAALAPTRGPVRGLIRG